MTPLVNCPGCGFRGRLPDALAGLKSIVCPTCKIAVSVEHLCRHSTPAGDETYPIWVNGTPPRAAAPAEADVYTGDYMKDDAERFAQYVAARLAELHKRRLDLAEAENRFESMTMERKREIHRDRAELVAVAEEVRRRDAACQEKEAGLAAREAELAMRMAELVAREGKVVRTEARAGDTDRRTAELRAAIDQLESRRAAVAEDRAALDRRAEELDRAELALHRRSAGLDELDERLRLEQEEFEREREHVLAVWEQVG